jgi:hypothetical protein
MAYLITFKLFNRIPDPRVRDDYLLYPSSSTTLHFPQTTIQVPLRVSFGGQDRLWRQDSLLVRTYLCRVHEIVKKLNHNHITQIHRHSLR